MTDARCGRNGGVLARLPSLETVCLCLTFFLSFAYVSVGAVHPSLLSSGVSPASLSLNSYSFFTGGCPTRIKTFTVNKVSDFVQRTRFPHVFAVVFVTRDIPMADSLLFTSNYSCTVVRALNLKKPVWLDYQDNVKPALRIYNATNIFFIGISVKLVVDWNNMPACPNFVNPEWMTNHICPAIHVYSSWNIRFTQGNVLGITMLYRCWSCKLSYMSMYSDYTNAHTEVGTGTVRVLASGDPIGLVRASTTIEDCQINGSYVAVILNLNAVGITLSNNLIQKYYAFGIQCGVTTRNALDCMLNTFQNNMIIAKASYNADGAGIYFGTHWFNPGNYATCNYIYGGQHCYYIDWASSGIKIDGSVCIGTRDGIKMNSGSLNIFRHIIMYHVQLYAIQLSCQDWCLNNCNGQRQEVQEWLSKYNMTRVNPAWKALWPIFARWCSITKINGNECNPNPPLKLSSSLSPSLNCYDSLTVVDGQAYSPTANATGNCSGLPFLNYARIIGYNSLSEKYGGGFKTFCASYFPKIVSRINDFQYDAYKNEFQFDDEANGDYGISDPSSPIYQLYPNFMSCPKSNIGPRPLGTAKIKPVAAKPQSLVVDAAASARAEAKSAKAASARSTISQAGKGQQQSRLADYFSLTAFEKLFGSTKLEDFVEIVRPHGSFHRRYESIPVFSPGSKEDLQLQADERNLIQRIKAGKVAKGA